MSLNDKLAALAARFAEEVAAVVREELMSAMGVKEPPTATATTALTAPPKRARAIVKAKAPAKRRYPEHCLAKGCRKPHGGPRSGFFCADHLASMSALERRGAQMAWKMSLKDD